MIKKISACIKIITLLFANNSIVHAGITALLLINSFAVHGEAVLKPQYHLTISSPIYRSATENISLDVTIPDNFKPVQTAAQASILRLLELIPKNEDKKNWTQMIMLQILGKQSIDAAEFTELVVEKVKNKLEKVQVLTKSTKSEKNYLVSTLGIYYETGSRREISYMNYYSSENHLSGMQYVRALKDNEKPEVVIQEMIVFVDKITKIRSQAPKIKPGLNVMLTR